MAAGLMVFLLLEGSAGLQALADPARAVREQAVEDLALRGPPTAELCPHLFEADDRIAVGVAAALERRRDARALPELLRCAGHEEASRGVASSRALVRIAFATGEPVTAAEPPLLGRRLAEAVEREVRGVLGACGGHGSHDRPLLYRAFLAGEAYSERALRTVMEQKTAPPAVRAHACHAYLRLLGEEAAPVFVRLLADAQPAVRAAAAGCITRLGDRPALEALAEMLDRGHHLQGAVLGHAADAARRTGTLSGAGAAHLEHVVWEGEKNDAVRAALALLATHPERARRAVRLRVRSYLASERLSPGAAAPATLFVLAGLPVGEQERDALRASADPLVRVAAETDAARTLEIVRPVLAPARPMGGREHLRVQILSTVLRRIEAPAGDRIAFARGALRSDAAMSRLRGLRVLQGLSAAETEPVAAALLPCLDDASESVRVLAAELLRPRARALETLAQALYDGDPARAARAAELLGVAAAAPADRRRAARELLRGVAR